MAWLIRLELVNPVNDDVMPEVRQLLLDTLAEAGFPAKSTTADWDLVDLSRRPLTKFVEQRGGARLLPRGGGLAGGRRIA